ncbi:MAG: S9 family peptidase [Bacteroidota bacterium]
MFILVIIFTCTTDAGLTPLIRRKVLFGNADHLLPLLSPDCKKLSYLAPWKGVMNIWVRNVNQTNDSVITTDSIRGIQKYSWAEDNRHILYLQDNNGDENYRLRVINIQDRSMKDLISGEGIQVQIIGADPKYPTKVLAGINLRDKKYHDVYSIDVITGEKTLVAENPGDVISWAVDSNLTVRAALALSPDAGYILRVREDENKPWRDLVTWSSDECIPRIDGFTADNEHLFVEDSRNSNTNGLVEISVKDASTKVLASDLEYDVSNVLISPTDRHLEAVSFYREREEWTFIDTNITKTFRFQEINHCDMYITSRADAGPYWVIKLVKDDYPNQYFLYNIKSKILTFLFSERSALEKYKLANMSPVTYTTGDSLVLHAYLTLPRGLDPDSLPMVVLVHDGPWNRDRWAINPDVQWLTNRGYACLQLNFRGSTGYGKKIFKAGNKEWGAKMETDIIDAIRSLVADEVIDPKRIAIMGEGYGGYAALAAAALMPDKYVCAISIGSPADLTRYIRELSSNNDLMKKILSFRIGDPEKDADKLTGRSPFSSVGKIKIPLFIAQGVNDPFVQKSGTDQFVTTLKDKGNVVQYLLFPDEGHELNNPANRLKFYEEAEIFLAKYLKGRVEE